MSTLVGLFRVVWLSRSQHEGHEMCWSFSLRQVGGHNELSFSVQSPTAPHGVEIGREFELRSVDPEPAAEVRDDS